MFICLSEKNLKRLSFLTKGISQCFFCCTSFLLERHFLLESLKRFHTLKHFGLTNGLIDIYFSKSSFHGILPRSWIASNPAPQRLCYERDMANYTSLHPYNEGILIVTELLSRKSQNPWEPAAESSDNLWQQIDKQLHLTSQKPFVFSCIQLPSHQLCNDRNAY